MDRLFCQVIIGCYDFFRHLDKTKPTGVASLWIKKGLELKIGLAQINPVIGDYPYNSEKIVAFADRARGMGCDLVVFPELSLCGYPPRDLLEKRDFVDAGLVCLHRLIESIRGIGVICGSVDKNPNPGGNALFNSAVLFEDGKRLHQVQKRLLPVYDVFDERRHFEPGTSTETFFYKGRRIGISICEDAWNDKDFFSRRIYSADPVSQLVKSGADLLVNISASPFFMGKNRFRSEMLAGIAKKYGIWLIYVNQVGGNDSVLFDGLSFALNPSGACVAAARDFAEDLVVVDIDEGVGDIHPVFDDDIEAVWKALVMGTADYVTKCGFSKVILGLSGGIDSALVACIAQEALGKENVTAVFMPSRYTSKDNFEDTRALAENLNIAWIMHPIDPIFEAFLPGISPHFDPGRPGVTEQNIQARIRGTLLMAISNRDGAMLLSTGNKSELAMGYCTLYGDMNGGLAVISDVPKTLVYRLARRINSEKEIIPERILEKAPSAELAPDQRDEDDLPPYEILDPILKAYIEDQKSAGEMIEMGMDSKLVNRVIRQVDRNEYKRYQAPPGLKVTSKAFGYGRRFPIAQRYRPEDPSVS